MPTILAIFQTISLIFAVASIATGLQALFDSHGFAKAFGIPIPSSPSATSGASAKSIDDPPSKRMKDDDADVSTRAAVAAASYVSLLGTRQLAQGLILVVFAAQGKWVETAQILCVLGVVVACTDGVVLSRRVGSTGKGSLGKGLFHAGPGLGIAGVAALSLIWG
ncbi:uncharacterized protein AB675_3580 [Cyphellophora attinorum]|uniref:Uncharacterized protein n=1 Tax=Cyphellophora attinorum TaxID=1664694 RepID=A0A0N1H5K1_9EURO|nr:uncharacterized protein AB675_3580 [Phialophora attinorum]KPI37063.1 hypothetical protein AB675_3580 [Phialophora attinorum]